MPIALHVLPKREVLRENLVGLIDKLTPEQMAEVYDMLMEAEMVSHWENFSNGVTQDWAEGKYDDFKSVLRRAREKMRQRAAS